MCIDLSEWSWSVKIFVSYADAHDRVSTIGEALNNQEDRMN